MLRYSFILLAAVIFVTTACQNNSELEQRISNLERRLAEVENRGVNVQPAMQPVSQPTSQSTNPAVTGGPTFKFEQTEFDFGRIAEGTVVNHVFEFTNVGDAPLIIQSASASCGCTVPKFTDKPIPVGGKGRIEVQFDSNGKAFQQSPVVTIVANTNPSMSRLMLKGFVEPKS
jgi:hypothetical protein